MVDFHFSRADLAGRYADELIGKGFLDFRSGLFLAAPRRTGKSTFLRQDLIPALAAREVQSVYVDLWSDNDRDPAQLIHEAVAARAQDSGWLAQAQRRLRIKSINFAKFVTFEFGDSSTTKDMSLTDLLAALGRTCKSDVALVVDEAQQALDSAAGMSAMFGLKAARDAFNQAPGADSARLILVFTGSDRNKLSQLTSRKSQPFYGARMQDFPPLDDNYCLAYTAWVNDRLAPALHLDPSDVALAFASVGRRPEFLQDAINDCLFHARGRSLLEIAKEQQLLRLDVHAARFHRLPLLQQAVLRLLVQQDDDFRPFTSQTLTALGERVAADVTASQVQSALEGLQKHEFIWNPGRGSYAIEDRDIADWLRSETA